MTFRTTDILDHLAAETGQDDPWSRYAWEIAQAEASQNGDSSEPDLWNPPEVAEKRLSAKARARADREARLKRRHGRA